MDTELTFQDKKRIEESIRQKYTKVAVNPEGLFRYPTGLAGLKTLNYNPDLIRALPDAATASYCGVGNPFTLGPIHRGEAVLDIGCGVGVDTMMAAMMLGPEGMAKGIEMVPEMIARARENLRMADLNNVTFLEASAEKLPFLEAEFDVVISNGVFNLLPDKMKALSEAFRVMKPKGRLMMADQILTGRLPEDPKARIESWFR